MPDYEMNRLANANNPYQGSFKRVLCVCSAGLLRSPTAAVVLSQEPYYYNTRAAGLVPEFALIPVDKVLGQWADEIVCMTTEQGESVRQIVPEGKTIVVLGIPDNFEYRSSELMERIRKAYDAYLSSKENQ